MSDDSRPVLPQAVGEEWIDQLDASIPVPSTPPPKLNGHKLRVDDRPEVRLGTDMHRVLDETARALARDPLTYQRAHELVTVVGAPDGEGERAPIPRGAPMIRALNGGSLIPRLTRFAQFLAFEPPTMKERASADEEGHEAHGAWREVLPPKLVVGCLLACADWPEVRTIVGVTETPLMRGDGTILQDRGYDPATGYLYVPSRPFPPVPDAPTQDNARHALADLAHVFVDFPYVDPAHAMVPIAALLSVLARPAIDGPVPAFLFDSSTRGSGKTLQADIVSLLATGRGAARATYPTEEDELAKVLLAYALAGCPTVLLDNVTRVLGGGVLDAVLTARDEVQFRVLGRNDAPRLPWRTVMFASGNNLALGEDTMRRVLVARLESTLENPEDRTDFIHPDLFAWVRDERPRLVSAGLTILRAYASHGSPDTSIQRWGTFEAWSALIPAAIVFAGGADPMTARPSRDSAISDELTAHVVILRELARLSADGMTVAEMIRALYPRPGHDDPPDGWDDLRDALEVWAPCRGRAAPDPQQLGRRFRSAKGRILNGVRLLATSARGGIQRWSVRAV